jgi:NhaA family Na+:H+ antiporter
VERLERVVHPWVSFLVLPLFALANAGVVLPADLAAVLTSPVSLGVVTGLVVGKPAGIVLASWLTVRLGWAVLPPDLTWWHVVGIGMLAGIGFTVSLFIGDLAFRGEPTSEEAKVAILVASLIAGLLGYVWLSRSVPHED